MKTSQVVMLALLGSTQAVDSGCGLLKVMVFPKTGCTLTEIDATESAKSTASANALLKTECEKYTFDPVEVAKANGANALALEAAKNLPKKDMSRKLTCSATAMTIDAYPSADCTGTAVPVEVKWGECVPNAFAPGTFVEYKGASHIAGGMVAAALALAASQF